MRVELRLRQPGGVAKPNTWFHCLRGRISVGTWLKRLSAGAALFCCLPVVAATVRWSGTSNRIYVENGGAVMLTDIKVLLPNAPLELVDPTNGVWLLGAELWLKDGCVLMLYSTVLGGDVNELRLKSDNAPAAGSFVSITADWGAIDIRSTRITSWDSAARGPDKEYKTYGRAFIRVRSSLAADGVTPLESRMDVLDSDIGYLGYEAAESYGLAWKVVGVHPDPTRSIFDYVKVRGDIMNSRIHDNYFGVYTFGAYGSQWLNNEVDHNAGYGLDPHDDSDRLVIEGNDVHDNGMGHLRNRRGHPRGLHGIIASRRCDRLTIRNNRSWANAGNGIMLHRHCDDSLIEDNQSYLNGDSGVAIFDSDRATVRNNLILSNANAGVRVSQGSSDNLIVSNQIAFSGTNGVYFYLGTNAPEPDPVDPSLSGRLRRNKIESNWVHDCGSDGLKLTDSDQCLVMGNAFQANGPSLLFENCADNLFVSNSIPTNVLVKLAGSLAVNTVVSFQDQPAMTVRMDPYCSGSRFKDADNSVFDADRAIFTEVSGDSTNAGSSLMLAWEDIGAAPVTVVRLDFHVYLLSGSVWVRPTLWRQSGDHRKAWEADAETDSAVDYVVGDLVPGADYSVHRGSKRIGTYTSDSNGRIRFTFPNGPGGSTQIEHPTSFDPHNVVTYTVDPR